MHSSTALCVFSILVSKPLPTAADRPQGRDDGEGMAGSGKTQQLITSNDAMVTRDEWWKKTLKEDAQSDCFAAVKDMIAMCNTVTAMKPHPICELTGETVTVKCGPGSGDCTADKETWNEIGREWKNDKGSWDLNKDTYPEAFTTETKDGNEFTIWNPACFVPDAAPTATVDEASTGTSGLRPMIALANHLSDELAKVKAQVISLEEYTFENGTPDKAACALSEAEVSNPTGAAMVPLENAIEGLDTLDLVTRAKKMSFVVKELMGKLYCLELAIRGPATAEKNERPKDVAAKGVGPLLRAIDVEVGKLKERAGLLKDDVIGE